MRLIISVCSVLSLTQVVIAENNNDLQQNHTPSNGEYRQVLMADGAHNLVIADPAANKSKITVVSPDGKPCISDYRELTSTLVIKTSDCSSEEKLSAFLYNDKILVPSIAATGFYTLTCADITEAITIANSLDELPFISEVYLDAITELPLRMVPDDPGFSNQWHLLNTANPQADINVEPVWNIGITGADITVGVIEGGWQTDHEDLTANYNPDASQTGSQVSSHATSVAGVIAAVANNNAGGAGAAYGANISNIFFGSQATNASAFGFRNDINDIKSNSWGPSDNGMFHDISSIEESALENAVLNGRNGLGEIFVWAGGNGGLADRTDYDPYVSSRFTICVGAIGDQDRRADYNETGSSMLIVTHSSGNNRHIYTTTSGNNYTSSFGGTSSAAPLVAGVIALILDANPFLSWRDVQHILVNSARMNDPADAQWELNAAGHHINYNYGFGAVDAEAAVTLATVWQNVAAETSINIDRTLNLLVPDNSTEGISSAIHLPVSQRMKLESVEVVLNVTTTDVGDLRIVLRSPDGTESTFATPHFDTRSDLTDYKFTSVRHWDEYSNGDWILTISDEDAGNEATWQNWSIAVHGTAAPVIPGDVNGDDAVDQSDLAIILASYGLTDDSPFYNPDADINADGSVDQIDLGILLTNFQG